jgi:hypothetical protein
VPSVIDLSDNTRKLLKELFIWFIDSVQFWGIRYDEIDKEEWVTMESMQDDGKLSHATWSVLLFKKKHIGGFASSGINNDEEHKEGWVTLGDKEKSSIPGHKVSHATWPVLFAYLERKVIIIPYVKKQNRNGIYSGKQFDILK